MLTESPLHKMKSPLTSIQLGLKLLRSEWEQNGKESMNATIDQIFESLDEKVKEATEVANELLGSDRQLKLGGTRENR